MALTNPQKVATRKWLGYSGRYFQTDTVLEQALAAINDADLEAEIGTLLTELATVDARRSSVRSAGGVAAIDEGDIQLQPGTHSQLAAVCQEGSLLVGRLAAMLGVPVRHDPFSTRSSPAGAYMQHG